MNQKCPQPEWWGETSTEFAGAEDLHLEASLTGIANRNSSTEGKEQCAYDLQGRRVSSPHASPTIHIINGKKYIIK